MKKVMILVSAIVLTASAATAAYVCSQKPSGLFEANVEALTRGEEGGYKCPGACLTWTGSTGGGLDCMCKRYAGRCKTWC